MNKGATIPFVLGLLFLFAFPVSAQETAVATQDNNELRLRARGIFRYLIRDREKFGSWFDEVQLHRARLDGRWTATKKLRLVLEMELTQEVGLRDAFARYEFLGALRMKVGHFKKPFSLLRMTSRWDLLIPRRGLIDRHVVGRSLFGGFGSRDAGLMIFGRVGKRKRVRFRYWLGVFDGWRLTDAFFRDPDEPNQDNTSHRDYVARLQMDFFERAFVGVSYNHKRARMALAPGAEMDRTFNAVGGDIRLALAGFGLQLEGIYATNPNSTSGHHLFGGHGIVSCRLRLSESLLLTPAFMIEFLDPDDEIEEKHALRLGGALNLDIGKHTRVVLAAEGGTGEMVWEEPEHLTWDQPQPVESASRKVETRIILQLNVML